MIRARCTSCNQSERHRFGVEKLPRDIIAICKLMKEMCFRNSKFDNCLQLAQLMLSILCQENLGRRKVYYG